MNVLCVKMVSIMIKPQAVVYHVLLKFKVVPSATMILSVLNVLTACSQTPQVRNV